MVLIPLFAQCTGISIVDFQQLDAIWYQIMFKVLLKDVEKRIKFLFQKKKYLRTIRERSFSGEAMTYLTLMGFSINLDTNITQ